MLRFSEITPMAHELYAFGDFTLDVSERDLSKAGRHIAVTPKAFDVLVHLVRHAGKLVTKQRLLDAVWSGSFVEEGILSVHISALRKALDDDDRAPRCIETVARSGYRFVAGVARKLPTRTRAGVFGKWGDADRSLQQPPADPSVYELVGRGRAHLLSHSLLQVKPAAAAYEKAIAIDPTFAPAHAGLAVAYCAQGQFRIAPPAEAFANARASALRALALDDASADAQFALGIVAFLSEWDWIGAERSLQRALDLDPQHVEAMVTYGQLLETQGRFREGLAMKQRALAREPLSPYVHQAIALSYWHQRKFDEMIAWANKTLALDPNHLAAREHLAGAYWAMGDFDRHMAENIKHAVAYGARAEVFEPMKCAYAAGGRTGVIHWVLKNGPNMPDVQIALLQAEIGNFDVAIAALNRVIDGRDPCLVYLAVAPQWDRLRADPRFDDCLARVGLPRSCVDEVRPPAR